MTRLEALEAVAKAASEALMAGEKRNGIILDGRTAKVIALRDALAALDAVPVEVPCPTCNRGPREPCPEHAPADVPSPMCRICGHTRGSHADGAGECEDAAGEATECQCPVYVPTHPVSCPRCNGTGRTP